MYCENPVPPLQEFTLTNDLISHYPCDKLIKYYLYYLLQSNTGPHVLKALPISFCYWYSFGKKCSQILPCKKVNSTFLCSSKDCTRYASKTKASKHKKMHAYSCLALHFAVFRIIPPFCHSFCHETSALLSHKLLTQLAYSLRCHYC